MLESILNAITASPNALLVLATIIGVGLMLRMGILDGRQRIADKRTGPEEIRAALESLAGATRENTESNKRKTEAILAQKKSVDEMAVRLSETIRLQESAAKQAEETLFTFRENNRMFHSMTATVSQMVNEMISIRGHTGGILSQVSQKRGNR